MDYLKQNHLVILVLVVLAASAYFGGSTVGSLGALDRTTVTNPTTFSSDVIFSGGDNAIVVTSSNTATSSIEVGCFQSYATSTATSLKLMFTASTTAPTNGSGVIPVISYGTCP